MSEHFSGDIKLATAGGTVFAFIIQLHAGEIANTAVLAAIGAIVSFIISRCCNYLFKKYRNKK